jgi:Protein of unknown function (DUF2867)
MNSYERQATVSLMPVVVRNRRRYSRGPCWCGYCSISVSSFGRFFGWDLEPPATTCKTFAVRLTDTDSSRSLVAAGTRDGLFRVVYRFENEQLLELINRTVHAAALTTLVETPTAYRFYLSVYVRSVSRFTPLYMTLIDPFRKLMVYPSLLRGVRARWNQAFGIG